MNKAVLLVLIATTSLTIAASGNNTWYLEQKIPPPDSIAIDHLWGMPVSVSGDVCVIGDVGDASYGPYSGAVHVYRFDGSNWVHEQKLTASDGSERAYFGIFMAIDGNFLVIAAPVFPSYLDEIEDSPGTAYIFEYNGNEWKEVLKFSPTESPPDDDRGMYVDIDDDLCLVAFSPYQVYLFRNDGEEWSEEEFITVEEPGFYPYFGQMSLFNVPLDYYSAFVVGLPGDDQQGENAGVVCFYSGSFGDWHEGLKLFAPDAHTGQQFGYFVAYTGQCLAVYALGAEDEESCIYMYRFPGPSDASGRWLPEQVIKAPPGDNHYRWDQYISLDGDRMIVTAFTEPTWESNYDVNGIAYIYEHNGAMWNLEARFEMPDKMYAERLITWPASIDGDVAVLGAPNGDLYPGNVYIYRRCPVGDVTGDCFVDLADFDVLASEWMSGFEPWPRW